MHTYIHTQTDLYLSPTHLLYGPPILYAYVLCPGLHVAHADRLSVISVRVSVRSRVGVSVSVRISVGVRVRVRVRVSVYADRLS